MPRIALGILLALLVLPAASPRTVIADEFDEQTAANTIKTLLESDPQDNLRDVWLLSESLAKAGKAAINPLNSATGTASPSQRLAIARALVLLEDYTRGLDNLKALVADDKVSVTLRRAALDVIGYEGELEEAEWLEDRIDTTFEPLVKLSMAKALWLLNTSNKGKGRDVMLEFLGSTDPDLRAEGALALGEIGAPEARPVLRELQREPTEQGRSAGLLIRIMQMQEMLDRGYADAPDAPEPDVPDAMPDPNVELGTWPLLDEIKGVLRRYYLDKKKVDSGDLEDAAALGLTRALDPHTNYMSPEMNAKLLESLDPSYGGVGAYVFNDVNNASRFTISRPIYGGPVYRAGLLAGDMVMSIEGETTEGLSVEDCVRLLKGPPGTQVTISVLRRGWTEPRDFTLTRARITIPTTAYDVLPGNIGFLQILHFSEDTSREVGEVLDRFSQAGVEAIIIDVRFNGGGYLRSAVAIASNFLPRGKVVVTERGRPDVYKGEIHRSTGSGIGRKQVPIRVLINQGTASAAEILAGALRDHGRARLIGSMTYGKGSAQISLPLNRRPGETFTDQPRESNVARGGDPFRDLNGNGRWDPGEPFQSRKRTNKRYDGPEKFTDKNGNGVWDVGEPLVDRNGDKVWTPGEPFVDANKNGKWDPGAALKLTIARYYTPNDVSPNREVKVIDGKVKVVGGIEPDLEAKPEELDFWEIQAQRKLESAGAVRDYVLKLFEDDANTMARLARSDGNESAAYPGFDAFYEGLDTKLSKEGVRWLVRFHTRRAMGDRLGRELVGDVVDDPALQVGLRDLFEELGKDLASVEGLKFLAK
ncbi:MAG: S41 family peptidase [Planctomycetota bacterium]|nr:S41 family peptidase [Planctomycetota bacterium]